MYLCWNLPFWNPGSATAKDSLIKNKVNTNYKKRIRKILKSSLNSSNVIVAINTWAVPLAVSSYCRCCEWTQTEMKALDVSIRKLLAMHKCFNVNHWLYVPRKLGRHGLLSLEDVVIQERCALGGYLKSSVKSWFKKIYTCGDFSSYKASLDFRKRWIQETLKTWRCKSLHGQFLPDISKVVDQNFQ